MEATYAIALVGTNSTTEASQLVEEATDGAALQQIAGVSAVEEPTVVQVITGKIYL